MDVSCDLFRDFTGYCLDGLLVVNSAVGLIMIVSIVRTVELLVTTFQELDANYVEKFKLEVGVRINRR